MENSLWAKKAKIVATVDLVMIALGILLLMLQVYLNGGRVNYAVGTTKSTAYWILGISIVVALVLVVLQVWAAMKLLKAGREGEDPQQALGMALFWRNVTIPIFILSIISYLMRLNIAGVIVLLIWRGVSFYVVINFIKELRSFLNSSRPDGNNQPSSVVTAK